MAGRGRSGLSPEIVRVVQFDSLFLWLLSGFLGCSMVRFRMPERTSTLQAGDRAPGFELAAANRQEGFSLARALEHGAVVLEFLRGTW